VPGKRHPLIVVALLGASSSRITLAG